jgi:hypothetical protein
MVWHVEMIQLMSLGSMACQRQYAGNICVSGETTSGPMRMRHRCILKEIWSSMTVLANNLSSGTLRMCAKALLKTNMRGTVVTKHHTQLHDTRLRRVKIFGLCAMHENVG